MNWLDVLMIVFSATAANHLGLVAAAENIIRHRLPVVNCPKCAAFWSVLAYSIYVSEINFPNIAAAFLSAWSAIWLDLLMGIIDKLYIKIYDKIYSTTDTTDSDALGTTNTVSDVR